MSVRFVRTTRRRLFQLTALCILCTPCAPILGSTPVRAALAARPHESRLSEKLEGEIQRLIGELPDPYDNPFGFAKAGTQIAKLWTLTCQWVVEYLDAHPVASAAELAAQTNELTLRRHDVNNRTASAVQLGTGKHAAYVVAVNALVTGTFFVVARQANGHFHLVWTIKDAAKQYPRDALGNWGARGQAFVLSGPLTGTVHELPPTRRGAPRFYVDGEENPAQGSEIPKQISIWEWNGTQPVPRFVGEYYATVDQAGAKLEGDLLKMETKEILKMLNTCSACTENAAQWIIRVTPDGVTDLGRTYDEPVYPFIDNLIDRAESGEDISDVAAPQIAADLRKAFARLGGFLVVGMGVGHSEKTDDFSAGLECLECDTGKDSRPFHNAGSIDLKLTIEHRNGKLYVTGGSVRSGGEIQ